MHVDPPKESQPSPGGDWSTRELAEFVGAISLSETEEMAIRQAVGRIAEALGAEACAYVRGGEIEASVGLGLDPGTAEAVTALASGGREPLEIPGFADAHTMVAAVVGQLHGHFVLARRHAHFVSHERALVRAMGGALSLTAGKIQAMRAERERWSLLTRLSVIQRSISHHAPVQDVLDAISEGARTLLGEGAAGVALLTKGGDRRLVLRSLVGLPAVRSNRQLDLAAASQPIDTDSVAVIDDRDAPPALPRELADAGVHALIAAPVREAGEVRGVVLVASLTPERTFTVPEREALSAFAEHASLALTDARLSDQVERALHDPLTGLPNRSFLIESLAERLRGTEPSPALLVLDLDSFRDINERVGHEWGDQLLVELARRLEEAAGGEALVARLEGDAFAIVAAVSAADELARRVLAAAASPFEVAGRSLRTTGSVGLVTVGEEPGQMLRDADLAMHRAKSEGGSRAVTFEPEMHAEVVRRLELQDDLARALEGDEIIAYFQPKVDLRSARVIGVEALVRWLHPKRGLVPPAEFVELAAGGGYMRALTERVIEYSIRAAGDWWRSGLGLQLSLNLAPSTFSDADWRLERFVARALEAAKLPATALQFEVTEDALMVDPDVAAVTLRRLSALGATISIDDFGTGHSSLGRLKSLPIDELKIDRSFVFDLDDGDGRTIVRSTIHLAHQMGLQVVAEGIETEDAWRELRSMGCERAQGFLIAKPMPARNVPAWLASWNQRARELSSAIRVQQRTARIAAAPLAEEQAPA